MESNEDDLQETEESLKEGGVERKKIQIVSKKQCKEFLFKQRVDKIKKFHEEINMFKQQKLEAIHGREDEGVSWGMGNDEEEIAAYQRK